MKTQFLYTVIFTFIFTMTIAHNCNASITSLPNERKILQIEELMSISQFKHGTINAIELTTIITKLRNEGKSIIWDNPSLSPNGDYIIASIGPYDPDIAMPNDNLVVLNIRNNSINKLGPAGSNAYIYKAVWDSNRDNMVYAGIKIPNNNEQKYSVEVWHMDIDGNNRTIIKNDENDTWLIGTLPSDDAVLLRVSGTDASNCFLYGENNRTFIKPTWPDSYCNDESDISPHVTYIIHYILSTNNNELLLYDIKSKRETTIFNSRQIILSKSIDLHSIISNHGWLLDDNSFLIQISWVSKYGKTIDNEIWKISVDGQAVKITRGVEIVAKSSNGLHWLLRIGNQYYMMNSN